MKSSTKANRVSKLLLLLISALGPTMSGSARADAPDMEYQVKASFLAHFLSYVTWQPGSYEATGDTLSITVLGKNKFGDALYNSTSLASPDRPVRVEICSSLDRVKPCQLLFVTGEFAQQLPQEFLSSPHPGMLTVGESAEFAEKGGMITFKMVNSKVRFEINKAAADESGLSISSQLLKLAVKVHGNNHDAK